MESTQERVRTSVDQLVDELDKKYLRDIQRKMFLCSSKCCENKNVSRDRLDTCIEKCNRGTEKAQDAIDKELGLLQQNLTACLPSCHDRVVQKLGLDLEKVDERQLKQFKQHLYDCVDKCSNEQLKTLPQIRDRILKSLSK
uniref:Protein FAM136A n=1 Tax=Bursaphelenchus xylophilus TaxID=6326 RepID=A0A1I7SUA1_BURXY